MKGVKGSTLPLSEEDAVKRVEEIIKRKNERPEISLSFLGFAEKWHGTTTKLVLHCNIHDLTWNTTSYNNFMKLKTIGCIKCKGDTTRRTHIFSGREAYETLVRLYEKSGIDTYDFSPVIETYKNFHESVTVICKKHGTTFSCSYSILFSRVSSNHCPDCYGEFRKTNRGLEESYLISKIENKISLLAERGFNLSFLGFNLDKGDHHLTTHTKLILHCNIHDVTWKSQTFSNFVNSNGPGCPQCSRHSKRSSGEKYCYSEVLKYVDIDKVKSDKIISFSDYRFYNITNTILPDIFITDFKGKSIIIEYDGEQHYKYIDFVHKSWERYIKQVRRDQYLEEYCKEHGIRLLRIPWLDEKRIPEVIRAFLVDGKDITTKVYPKIPPVVII